MLFFLELATTCLVLISSLLALFFLKLDCLLALKFDLGKFLLTIELVGLFLKTLFLQLCNSLLFSSLCGIESSFVSFLLKTDSLGFLFLLSLSLLAFKHLLSKAKFFFVTQSLHLLSLLEFLSILLCQLSLDLSFKLFSLALQTSLLLFVGLLSGSLFSFVFGPVSLTHLGKFLLTELLLFLSLGFSLGFLLGEADASCFELSHAGQLLLFLLLKELFFFKFSLAASLFLSSLGFKAKTFNFG